MKKAIIICLSICSFFGTKSFSQSFELMQGSKGTFIDVQWLKSFDKEYRYTLFSRTRATIDKDNRTDIFSGAYLNYTSNYGIGVSLVGAIASAGPTSEIGIHYFISKKDLLIFALLGTDTDFGKSISWFSILRYRPNLNKELKLYTSLELYSKNDLSIHLASVERMRMGLDYKSFQFGAALNLTQIGENYQSINTNPGFFIRKEF